MRLALFLFCFTMLGAGSAEAQTLTTNSGVAVYRYANPGQPTMDVRVWGAVRSPGVYQVERDMDLIEVLTLAGGPSIPSADDRSVRNVHVEILREAAAGRTAVLTTTLDALTALDTPLPDLQDGDLVSLSVQTQQRFTWRDALSVTTSVAALAVLVLRILE
ncbi:MAG: SLBB domain-containing protein [Rhodothermales bacterium]